MHSVPFSQSVTDESNAHGEHSREMEVAKLVDCLLACSNRSWLPECGVYTCHPRTQEVGTGGSGVPGQVSEMAHLGPGLTTRVPSPGPTQQKDRTVYTPQLSSDGHVCSVPGMCVCANECTQ